MQLVAQSKNFSVSNVQQPHINHLRLAPKADASDKPMNILGSYSGQREFDQASGI